MQYFMNPIFLSKAIKSYVFDINRLRKINNEELKKYQEKQIKKMVKYADNKVALYHKKFKDANVSKDEINSIYDLTKLPFVTKEEFAKADYKDLVPSNLKEKQLIKTSTSGTSGNPASIYVTLPDIAKGLFGYLRVLREHNINWRKDKIAFLLDLREESAERRYLPEGIMPALKPILSFENIKIFSINTSVKKLVKELNEFQPDFIGGYVGILSHLAVFKEKSKLKDISPRIVVSSGTHLNKYLRKFLEETFNTSVFEAYGATEAGPIAFECKKGKFHIHDDLVYMELIKGGKLVSDKEPGSLVVTKLYGEGTPIIRYTGINDILSISDDTCDCGLAGRLINRIYGRENFALIFPGGRIMLPSTTTEVLSKTLYDLKTRMIKRTQIVQHKIDKIEIGVVIDHRFKDYTKETLFSSIKDSFYEKIGTDIDVNIKVKEIKKVKGVSIISKIDKEKYERKIYL